MTALLLLAGCTTGPGPSGPISVEAEGCPARAACDGIVSIAQEVLERDNATREHAAIHIQGMRDVEVRDVVTVGYATGIRVNATGCTGCSLLVEDAVLDLRRVPDQSGPGEFRGVHAIGVDAVTLRNVTVVSPGGGFGFVQGVMAGQAGGGRALLVEGDGSSLLVEDLRYVTERNDTGMVVEVAHGSTIGAVRLQDVHAESVAGLFRGDAGSIHAERVRVDCAGQDHAPGIYGAIAGITLQEAELVDCDLGGVASWSFVQGSIEDSRITDSVRGIWLRGTEGSLVMRDTVVSGHERSGIDLHDVGILAEGLTVEGNGHRWEQHTDWEDLSGGIVLVGHTPATVRDSHITDNRPFAISPVTRTVGSYFFDDGFVDARNNWWGASTGPMVYSGGLQDLPMDHVHNAVTDDVVWIPYRDSP